MAEEAKATETSDNIILDMAVVNIAQQVALKSAKDRDSTQINWTNERETDLMKAAYLAKTHLWKAGTHGIGKKMDRSCKICV